MATISLNIDIPQKVLADIDKEKLSFLVSRVFEEYLEDLQDEKLSQQINNSKELDDLIANIKF